MDICILSDRIPGHGAGGAGTIAWNLAKGYEEAGHNVRVVSTVRQEEEAGDTETDGISVTLISTPEIPELRSYYSIYNPFTVTDVGKALSEFSPDVVHAHNVHQFLSYHTLKLAHKEASAVVVTYHDAMSVAYGKLRHFVKNENIDVTEDIPASAYKVDPLYQAKARRLRYFPLRNRLNDYYLSRYVDAGVSVSDELRRALTVNGIDCSHTIHNGVDVDQFRQGDPSEFRAAHDLGDRPIVLFSGRVGYWKGGEQLARSFDQIRREPKPLLVVTGRRSDYVERMRSFVSDEQRVRAVGYLSREGLVDAYHAARTVAVPSIYLDPFPTVNLESMCAGTPPVVTCLGGSKELVTDGETGCVVNPLRVSSLRDGLEKFLYDSDHASQCGRRARSHVENNFTIERQVNEYIRLFEVELDGS